MSKEIISPNSIVAGTPDWQEGYEQGLLKSIALIRDLQITLVNFQQRHILDEAMELIANKIEANNE